MRAKIYLSGPVEKVDNPETWRVEMQEEYGYYYFVDPCKLGFDEETGPFRVTWGCLNAIMLSDALFVNYTPGEETWGTPMEVMWAWFAGIPVVVWTDEEYDNLPKFLQTFSVHVSDEQEECLRHAEFYI